MPTDEDGTWIAQARTVPSFVCDAVFRVEPSFYIGPENGMTVEVTFAEMRRHLGVETQRQWSDLAIARTIPCLLALFSLVTLWASDLAARGLVLPRRAAWYTKPAVTFSNALAAIRRQLWIAQAFSTSAPDRNMVTIPRALLDSLTEAACYPA